jgi:transcriptional repressor of cell division inhibition gene dicB
MRKTEVLSHWNNNGAAVARAIGITKSAVSQWGDVIPEAMAYRVQEASGGVLKVDPAIYRSDIRESA